MAKKKSKVKEEKAEAQAPEPKFVYQCPSCTQDAIATSNKMLDVEVDCAHCGKRVKLDNEDNYRKL